MINGLQHVAIGSSNLDAAVRFYAEVFGFQIRIADLTATFPEFLITKGLTRQDVELRIVFLFHPLGGAGLELVQRLSSPASAPLRPAEWGELGFIELGLEVRNADWFHRRVETAGAPWVSSVEGEDMGGGQEWRSFYLRDPDGLLIQIIEKRSDDQRPRCLGVHHVGIGVSHLPRAQDYYGRLLGFDCVYDRWRGTQRANPAVHARELHVERMLLARSQPSHSAIPLFDRGMIKLICASGYRGEAIYRRHRWGDLGLFEICLDTTNLREDLEALAERGARIHLPFRHLPLAAGLQADFGYLLGPDDALIEIAEITKLLHLSPARLSPLLSAYRTLSGYVSLPLDLTPLFRFRGDFSYLRANPKASSRTPPDHVE